MSRLAKKPVNIISGVTVTQDGNLLNFKGPKGEKQLKLLDGVAVKIEGENINVSPTRNSKVAKMNTGTMWALIRNAISGLTTGFSKVLEIEGVGFKAALEGKTLVLNLGFVNPVRFESPEGITITVEKNVITISGSDKQAVGQAAAQIRSFKKPEPYKGKGIRYRGEVVRRKSGKKAAAAA